MVHGQPFVKTIFTPDSFSILIYHIRNTPTSIAILCKVIASLLILKGKFKDRKMHLLNLIWPSGGPKATAKRKMDNIKLARKPISLILLFSMNDICCVRSE